MLAAAAAAGAPPGAPARRPAIRTSNRTAPTAALRIVSPGAVGRRPPAPVRGLAGPVDVALARAQDTIPGPHALPGGSRYELKFDGYRGAITHGPAGIRIWSRNRTDFCRWLACCRTVCCA